MSHEDFMNINSSSTIYFFEYHLKVQVEKLYTISTLNLFQEELVIRLPLYLDNMQVDESKKVYQDRHNGVKKD